MSASVPYVGGPVGAPAWFHSPAPSPRRGPAGPSSHPRAPLRLRPLLQRGAAPHHDYETARVSKRLLQRKRTSQRLRAGCGRSLLRHLSPHLKVVELLGRRRIFPNGDVEPFDRIREQPADRDGLRLGRAHLRHEGDSHLLARHAMQGERSHGRVATSFYISDPHISPCRE